LSFDQRHTIVLTFDYRFGSGKDYRGPRSTVNKGKSNEKNFNLFDDMGANIVFRAGSGNPYSRQSNVTPDAQFGVGGQSPGLAGSINGSYLPWNYSANLRIDKNVDLRFASKKEGAEAKRAQLNIYLQVLNLFNTANIMNVYHYTGDPKDDGYLQSPKSQNSISQQTDPQSFRDLYNTKLQNPANFSRARVVRLGAVFSF
jgi:hypothetical protein